MYNFCSYPCLFCKKKLKRSTKVRNRFGTDQKITDFQCDNCTELIDLFGSKKIVPKMFLSYFSETGKPAAYEISVANFRILCHFPKKKAYISKLIEIPEFNSMGQKLIKRSYNIDLVIDSIPALDFTNENSILDKIKVLMTFS